MKLLLTAVAAALLGAPTSAAAHAVLEETSPPRGATVERQPDQVSFGFNEPVEGSFGAVRVFDGRGEQVDDGEVSRPDGSGRTVAVGLDSDLPDGSYTATFRVVSADAHPVSGGFVFSIGRPGAAAEVGSLIGKDEAGTATDLAFGAARAVSYAAIAFALGGALFLLLVWAPALRGVACAGGEWLAASEAFGAAFRRIGLWTVAVGAAATVLGILLQGAEAGGTTFWAALDPSVVGDVLATRFGTAWVFRLAAYALLAGLLLLPATRLRPALLRPASLGAAGAAVGRAAGPGVGALAAMALAYLLVSPALAGHASTQDPGLLLVPADVLHVAAMSAWVGGIGFLVLAVPSATRCLGSGDRSRLLAAVVGRFSTLALVAVAVLLASGITQSIVHLESLGDLTGTAFGRAILVKAALFLALVGLGAYNRRRLHPQLRQLAAGGQAPGDTGLVLRRTLRSELALMAAVLGVTAALTSYPPPSAAVSGPFAESARVGPAQMELTLDPARVGRNELHLYLFDPRTGAQYDRVKELRLDMTLPDRQIGPIELEARKAGPGHYIVPRADLAPAGDWRLRTEIRVSAFDVYEKRLEVPVR